MTSRELLQQRYRSEPWRLLVCCVLLNQTSRRQVDTVVPRIFELWPTPRSMANADQIELSEFLRPLGFHNVKAKRLVEMSWGFVNGADVSELYGVGKYALDSYRLFVLGDTSVEPTDKELLAYMEEEVVRG
jgi:methyl-CpG-binding domain protein 4